jgi:hypothetical protein
MLPRHLLQLAASAAFVLLLAPPAGADLPPVGNSTSPAFIHVVGSAAGVPDTVSGKFIVTLRDIANNPVANAFVHVDFSGCADIRIASNQLNPNYVVNCTNHTVGTFTNTEGIAALTVLGNSWFAGTYSGLVCARIYADGVLLSSPTVSTYDLDGAGGVTAGDLSAWLGDLGSGVYRGRSDYDGNGVVSAGDLSLWLVALGGNRSKVTGASCP